MALGIIFHKNFAGKFNFTEGSRDQFGLQNITSVARDFPMGQLRNITYRRQTVIKQREIKVNNFYKKAVNNFFVCGFPQLNCICNISPLRQCVQTIQLFTL